MHPFTQCIKSYHKQRSRSFQEICISWAKLVEAFHQTTIVWRKERNMKNIAKVNTAKTKTFLRQQAIRMWQLTTVFQPLKKHRVINSVFKLLVRQIAMRHSIIIISFYVPTLRINYTNMEGRSHDNALDFFKGNVTCVFRVERLKEPRRQVDL